MQEAFPALQLFVECIRFQPFKVCLSLVLMDMRLFIGRQSPVLQRVSPAMMILRIQSFNRMNCACSIEVANVLQDVHELGAALIRLELSLVK